MVESGDNDIDLGKMALDQNDFHKATFLFTRAQRNDPSSAEAHKWLARTFYRQGCFPEALKAYHDCLTITPTDYAAVEGAGLTYYGLGKYEAAIQQMEFAATIDSASPQPYVYLSRFHRGLKHYAAARESLAQAVALCPNAIAVYLEQGLSAREQGDVAEAMHFYQLATELEPGNSNTPYRMGCLQNELKDYEGARRSFLRSLNLSPDWPDALYGLAFAEIGLRHTSSAIEMLETAIHLKPGLQVAYVQLARLYLRSFRIRDYWRTIKRGVAFGVRNL